jgi:hypothetical protein
VPGGGAMHLNDSLSRCEGVDFVCNLHEQAAQMRSPDSPAPGWIRHRASFFPVR